MLKRVTAAELMDQASPDEASLTEALVDLAWLNRWLGGTATIIHQLNRLLDGDELTRLKVLDIGAGRADILVSLGRWCVRRGHAFEGVALDFAGTTARIAERMVARSGWGDRIRVVRGDARALPFSDGASDVVICSTFLHHLEPDDAVLVLREMRRVSRLGIVVSDLRRGPLGYVAAWLLANTVWRRHGYTHHDSTASMRAAYTIDEAHELAGRAGLVPEIEPQLWFRWALRWKRA